MIRPALRDLARALVVSLALLAATLVPARAQSVVDDPDLELAYQFMHDPAHAARMVDMAYTKTGYLIVVFIELVPGKGSDRIVVVQRDPAGKWLLLSNASYGWDHILELSIALPERGGGGDPERHRVYIAAQFATDAGLGADIEYVGLVSGPWLTPWKGPGRLDFVTNVGTQVPPRPWTDMNPVVACVPRTPKFWDDYVVELAFAYPRTSYGQETSVYVAQSFDFGRNLAPAIEVAGPGVTTGPQELMGSEYRAPSLCADSDNGMTALAFEDHDAGVIRIASRIPSSPRFDLAYSTAGAALNGKARIEGAPQLAALDGELNMTYVEYPQSGFGQYGLGMLTGNLLTSSFVDRGTIHGWVDTPGDIDLREGTAYVAARFYLDNVMPQTPRLRVWEGPRFGVIGTFTSVNDHPNFSLQPRIAVSDDGPMMQSVGYTTYDWSGSQTWMLNGGYLNVDL